MDRRLKDTGPLELDHGLLLLGPGPKEDGGDGEARGEDAGAADSRSDRRFPQLPSSPTHSCARRRAGGPEQGVNFDPSGAVNMHELYSLAQVQKEPQ